MAFEFCFKHIEALEASFKLKPYEGVKDTFVF